MPDESVCPGALGHARSSNKMIYRGPYPYSLRVQSGHTGKTNNVI